VLGTLTLVSACSSSSEPYWAFAVRDAEADGSYARPSELVECTERQDVQLGNGSDAGLYSVTVKGSGDLARSVHECLARNSRFRLGSLARLSSGK